MKNVPFITSVVNSKERDNVIYSETDNLVTIVNIACNCFNSLMGKLPNTSLEKAMAVL